MSDTHFNDNDRKAIIALASIAVLIVVVFISFSVAISANSQELSTPLAAPSNATQTSAVQGSLDYQPTLQPVAELSTPIKSLANTYPDFTVLAEQRSPAVVKISTVISGAVNNNGLHGQLPPGAPEIFRHFFEDPHNMPRRDESAMGSGFFISSDGYVLTNNHVIENASKITVRLIDRREYEATLVGADPQSDLALLKIEEVDLSYLTLSNSDNLKVGQWVVAIGSPFGLDYSVSAGIVSAIGRSIPSQQGNQNYVPFIQTDVAINPGNSGGPLFNLEGEVVGINSQIYTRSGGSNGLSFAIPSSLASNVVSQLKDSGQVERGWLGVAIQDVDKDLAISFGLNKPQGALITQVEVGGPADRGGLKVGDVVLRFNGKSVNRSSDLPLLVGPIAVGTEVKVEILRERKNKTLRLDVGKRGSANTGLTGQPSKTEMGTLGVEVQGLTRQQRSQLGVEAGVLVVKVEPASPADKSGVRPGDVIVQLGFKQIDSIKDFDRAQKRLPKGAPQPIRIIRDGSSLFRSIVLPK